MKIIIHTLNTNSHFEYFRRYFNLLLGKEHDVFFLIAQEKKSSTKKSFLYKIRERYKLEKRLFNIASRNGEISKYMRNRFLMIFYKKYKSLYDEKKISYIKNYFDQEVIKLPSVDQNKIFYIQNINDEEELIKNLQSELLIVVGAPFIKEKILNLFSNRINLHIGYLPFYRGILCNEIAYLKGDYEHIGYSIHELSYELDKGWIYKRENIHIKDKNIHMGKIYIRLYLMAFENIIKYVNDICPLKEIVEYMDNSLYNSYSFNPMGYKELLKNGFHD